MFVSETFTIWDCLFYLTGTSDTNNWVLSNTSATYSNEGTHFTSEGTSSDNNINLIVSSATTPTAPFNSSNGLTFEFDFKTTNSIGLYFLNNGNSRVIVQTISSLDTWLHIKWVYNPSTSKVTYYIDNNNGNDVSVSLSQYVGFQLHDWQKDIDCWIKNLKVY